MYQYLSPLIGNLPQVGDERFVTPCLVTTFPAGPVGSEPCPFLGPVAPALNDSRDDDDVSFNTLLLDRLVTISS